MLYDYKTMNVSELTTYQALVYQSKANRSVKAQFEKILRDYNLTMMQWSVLGFIKEAGKQGVRISDLAETMDTSLAFITNSVNALEAKGVVFRVGHEHDNRAKIVRIAPAFSKKIAGVEQRLRAELRSWLDNRLTTEEIESYVNALRLMGEQQPQAS
jgi:DNA-binding MarR family transcriptional regulator